METFAELLTTGDAGSLALAVIALAIGGLLVALAVHIRPRSHRRIAR